MVNSPSEIALTPFFNWFVNGCSDVWSSPNYFKKTNNKLILPKNGYFQNDVIGLFAYGAKNSVIVCQLHGSYIRYAFNIKAFESIQEKVTCVSFARCLQKPKLFIGSNLGNSIIYHFDEKKIQICNVGPSEIRLDKIVSSSDWANNHIVFYSKDTRIVQWDFEKNSCCVEFESPCGYRKIDSIVVTKIDPLMIAMAFSGGQILLIKLEELNLVNYTKFAVLNLGPSDICSLAFPFHNGKFENGLIAAISRNGNLKVWELDSRTELFNHQLEIKSTKYSRTKNFFSIVFIPTKPKSSDSAPDPQTTFKLLMSKCNGEICVVDIPSETKAASVKNIQKITSYGRFTHSNVVFNISVVNPFHYKSDDKIRSIQPFWDLPEFAVSISLDHSIILTDLSCLKVKSTFPTLSHQVHDLEFNPEDNNQLAIASGDGLKIWRFSHQRKTRRDENHAYPSYYRVSNIQRNLPANTKVVCLAWHPQQKPGENVIAIGNDDGEIFCLDITSSSLLYASTHVNVPRARVYSAKWGPIPENHRTDDKAEWGIYCVYQTGVVKVHIPKINKVFDLDKLCSNYIHGVKKTDCVWRSDFNYLAIGYNDGYFAICLNDKDLIPIIVFTNLHSQAVSCIRWHPDYMRHYDEFNNITRQEKSSLASWIATGSNDCTVQIVDLDPFIKQYMAEKPEISIYASESKHILMGHSARIISLSWSTCAQELLASCSADTTVQVWQAEQGIPLYNFRGHWSRIFCLTWAPWSEDLIFSAGDDSTLQAWVPSVQEHSLPPDNVNTTWEINRDSSPQPALNKSLEEEFNFDQLVDPLLADDQPCENESSFEILNSSPPSFKALLKSISGEIESTSSESVPSPNISVLNGKPDENQEKEHEQVPESQSSGQSRSRPATILSRLKNSAKSMNEYTMKEKKKSLLPLSNITENCSTKLQTIQDIEYLIGRKYTVPEIINDAEVRERNLLFLDEDDVKELVQKEINNHKQNKNFSLAFQVSALSGNLKDTIIEATRANQLNDWLVAMSASISREFWSKTTLLYALQLEKSNESAQAALYYSSVHRINDAVRVLVKAGLYKESLILVKNCASFNSQLIRDILDAWAKSKESQDNLEFAAKIYAAILEPKEAVRCLAQREDDPKCKSLCDILESATPLVINPN